MKMKHEDLVDWVDQLENSLLRAEKDDKMATEKLGFVRMNGDEWEYERSEE